MHDSEKSLLTLLFKESIKVFLSVSKIKYNYVNETRRS